jgi:uncharacterized protein with PQ loop repeat
MSSSSSLQAFSAASGVSADSLSLCIRTSLLVGFFMWAAWCVLILMKYHKAHNSENISTLLTNYVQLFFLVSVVVALVFTT